MWYVYRLKGVPLDDGLAAKIAAKNGVPLDDLSPEMIAKWFAVSVDLVTDGGNAIKRYMPVDVKPTKAEALAVAEALGEE